MSEDKDWSDMDYVKALHDVAYSNHEMAPVCQRILARRMGETPEIEELESR